MNESLLIVGDHPGRALMPFFVVALLSALIFLAAPSVSAAAMDQEDEAFLEMVEEDEARAKREAVADPIEEWNRLMFDLNDTLWVWVLRPVTIGYETVVPASGRVIVKDFFHNITAPIRLVASLLQGEFGKGGQEIARFGINTTLGAFGLFDVADLHFGMEKGDEDVGQAIGSYGVGHGFYVVWPLFGPSSARDTVGMVGDWVLNPLTYYPEDALANMSVKGVQAVNTFSFHRKEVDELRASAFDPYIALRDFYIKKRAKEVQE